ncbi:NYN domain-containing protein [Lentinula raphanica]|nr:NYN domain-containing protein [Lentinula raphanica]
MKPQEAHIAIFWDYENCSVPSNLSGYDVVKQIRSLAHEFGSIKLLKAYTQLSEQTMNSSRSFALRSELQSSGVSITDCPHNKFKNVADQMIIVDMLAFAMDNPSGPATVTIMLISGDRDFAYALSTLQLRKYNIVVVAPSTIHASLRAQTSTFFDWDEKILTGAGKYRPTPNFNQHTRDQSSHSSNDATCTVAAKNSYGPSNAPRCTAFGTPAGAINGGPPYPQNVRSGDSYKKELKPSQACTVADAAIDPSPPRLECSPPCSNVLPPDSPTKSHNNRYSTMRAAADKSPPGYSDSTETFWRDKPSYWASPYKASHVQHFPDNASRGAIHTQTQESSHLSSEPLARPSDQHCGDVDEPSSPRITRPLPYRAAKDISSKQDTGDSLEGPSVGYRDFLSGSQLPSSPSRSRSAEPYFSAKTTKGLASQALNAQQSRNINHSLPTTKGQASKAVNALQSSNINHSLPTTRQTNTQTLPVLSSPIVLRKTAPIGM